jgi:hypothetical protein
LLLLPERQETTKFPPVDSPRGLEQPSLVHLPEREAAEISGNAQWIPVSLTRARPTVTGEKKGNHLPREA